jgi:hypothetical protein
LGNHKRYLPKDIAAFFCCFLPLHQKKDEILKTIGTGTYIFAMLYLDHHGVSKINKVLTDLPPLTAVCQIIF